ncbi:MAG: hypothetical protein HN368_19770 [Spirochaetales bacterium]|jgi:hypothetical protein|nr:hypothetical protein [Spirochaetales bacterium]
MGLKKNSIDELRDFLFECVKKEGTVLGKRRFSLELGMLENALFDEIDKDYSSFFPMVAPGNYGNRDLREIEELPVVDEDGKIVRKLNAVS